MSKEYSLIATQLAQNIAGAWKLIGDKGLSPKGIKEIINASIKPTQALLKLAENHNVSNAYFKNRVLKQVQNDLEQEKNNILSERV